ncbi:MAG: hypothetical protein ACLT8E_06160 [Akkermansia sp.]
MSTEHSHEHFPEGASCCSGSCGSGSCCCSGDAIGPVPAVLGIALFVAALVMGSDSWSGMGTICGGLPADRLGCTEGRLSGDDARPRHQ